MKYLVLWEKMLIFNKIKKRNMWSLNCDWFHEEFETVEDLVEFCLLIKMDFEYNVTYNGRVLKESLIEMV